MKIIDIACGARHTLCLNGLGDIYSFGDNSEGQSASETNRVFEPQLAVTSSPDLQVKYIFSGETHCGMITTNGELYMWGDATAGRLGFDSLNQERIPTLVLQMLGKCIINVGIGGQHTIVFIGSYDKAILNKKANQLAAKSLELFLKQQEEQELQRNSLRLTLSKNISGLPEVKARRTSGPVIKSQQAGNKDGKLLQQSQNDYNSFDNLKLSQHTTVV